MLMDISSGPYKGVIPFVNLQGTRIDLDSQGQIVVDLEVSNEISKLRNKPIDFGNYIFLSSDKLEIERLSADNILLINKIKDDKKNQVKCLLSKEDFIEKAFIKEETGEKVYNNTYVKSFNLGEQDTAYVLMVSYLDYKNIIVIGNIIKEIILINGKAMLTSQVYSLSETAEGYGSKDTIWPSTVQIDAGKIRAGIINSSKTSPILLSRPILNIKTKDLRVLKLAESLSFNSDVGSSDRSYFSAITLSKNKASLVHGLFSFNLLKYAQDNTKYGSIIKNDLSLLSAIDIKDIVVFRRTVNPDVRSNTLTAGKSYSCGFKESNSFIMVASHRNGVQVFNTEGDRRSLNISFVDKTAANISAGMLEYKVEIVAADKTSEAVDEIATKLMAELKKYEHSSSKHPKELIDLYLASISFIKGREGFIPLTSTIWQKDLLALTSFGAGSQQDRMRVMSVVKNYIKGIKELFAVGVSSPSNPLDVNSKISNSKKETFLRTSKVFDEKYAVSPTHATGLDYLDEDLQNTAAPMPRIGFSEFSTRTSKEVTKYPVGNPNATSINHFGFLSPRSVYLKQIKTDIPTDKLKRNSEELLPLVRSKISLEPILDLKVSNSNNLEKGEILKNMNIRISPLPTNLKKMVFEKKMAGADCARSDYYLGDSSQFVFDKTVTEMNNSGSGESIIQAKNGLFLDSVLPNLLINKKIIDFKDDIRISNRDNLNGSIALRAADEDSSALPGADAISSLLNFGSIVQIQYLDSSHDQKRPNNQDWKLLDKPSFETAAKDNRGLLCRLVKVDSGLCGSNIIELEPMGSIFTLGPLPIEIFNPGYRNVIDRETQAIIDETNRLYSDDIKIENLYSKNTLLVGGEEL
jgi:hypothetical protein